MARRNRAASARTGGSSALTVERMLSCGNRLKPARSSARAAPTTSATATGTPVLAVGPGRVAFVGNHFFSGKAVYVDHGDGLTSMSIHLSRIDVKKGQEVKTGDRLGLSGATGRVSGPHLHFGLKWHGATIDPAALVGASPRVVALPAVP